MKTKTTIVLAILCLIALKAQAQTNFNLDAYQAFMQRNKDLTAQQILERHRPSQGYYSMVSNANPLGNYLFLDSIVEKYELTQDELLMLEENRFVVTERLSNSKMALAFDDVYKKDLPVFVSTDAILHALHISYANILRETELDVLKPILDDMIDKLYNQVSMLTLWYGANHEMQKAMEDVDLYITIAKNLITGEYYEPKIANSDKVEEVWSAIHGESLSEISLFTDIPRLVDFSQFIVRGHYLGDETLEKYFKSMMWLGRMEFVLANAPKEWYEAGFDKEGLRRLNMAGIMLKELVNYSGVKPLLDEADGILQVLIGKSDNLSLDDFSEILYDQGIRAADDLLLDNIFDQYQETLQNSPEFNQQILSGYLKGTSGAELTAIPLSLRLLGQRYVVDSHVLSNLVYDNIVYQDSKMCRMMPDPLDALFVLGNDNALPLLETELETWKYAPQAAGMRYLVETHQAEFWDMSLYNSWLQAIRFLKPDLNQSQQPLFMQTVAWQQQKMNTQLASWTQLRHDNLLYTKQSYTHGGACSFPHSYVEPYPDFYRQIQKLAEQAAGIEAFKQVRSSQMDGTIASEYFDHLIYVMDRLASIADKELYQLEFNEEDIEFLQSMIFNGLYGWYNGWYVKLLFGTTGDEPGGSPELALDNDYIVADVHTQPTLCDGTVVGKVLHVGVGKVNFGIFLAESPSVNYEPMAYVGPVMSYYETITDNFERLTDQTWAELVHKNDVPERPDWVNIYLADSNGIRRPPGRELTGVLFTGLEDQFTVAPHQTTLDIYPNPTDGQTIISLRSLAKSNLEIRLKSMTGQLIETIFSSPVNPGETQIQWNMAHLPDGIYFVQMITDEGSFVKRIVKQ